MLFFLFSCLLASASCPNCCVHTFLPVFHCCDIWTHYLCCFIQMFLHFRCSCPSLAFPIAQCIELMYKSRLALTCTSYLFQAWMKGLSVVVELQPQLFLEPTTGCFVTGFDCYERIKAGLFLDCSWRITGPWRESQPRIPWCSFVIVAEYPPTRPTGWSV